MHEIHLDRYTPTPAKIMLGTCESYGVEQVKLVPGDGWGGLDMVCTWHPPMADPVRMLVPEGGVVDVPPEATARSGIGTLVVAGMADGVLLASCDVEYRVRRQSGVAGKPADEPTPDLVQQVVGAANRATAVADGVRKDMGKVLAAETGRETAETARAAAEAAREKAESARAAAEKSRETAESDRVTAETARQQAEADRKSAEDGRAAAESARQTDETTRQQAETTRKSSESTRESAEADRVKSEKSRASAESNRASAESKRASAESARASAESARETSENHRVSAENERVTSEQARETAEAGRVNAETARAEAETEREKQLPALKSSVDELRARQNILVGSKTGNPVIVDDAFASPLCGLTVYGKSTQDGTPTPDAPVPIVSAGDGGTVVLTLGDGNGKTQTLTLPTPTGLPGIPVTSGGNYTDPQGQQWVCDEVDLERGVRVQRVYKVDVDGENVKFAQVGSYANLTSRGLPFALIGNGQKTYAVSTFTNLVWNYNSGSGFLYLVKDNISDKLNESCKKQLGKVYYALANPIETPLAPAEIAAYKALTAYAPNTVVQASDGAGVKLEYQRDVNIAIKKLEDAIASMTTT